MRCNVDNSVDDDDDDDNNDDIKVMETIAIQTNTQADNHSNKETHNYPNKPTYRNLHKLSHR